MECIRSGAAKKQTDAVNKKRKADEKKRASRNPDAPIPGMFFVSVAQTPKILFVLTTFPFTNRMTQGM